MKSFLPVTITKMSGAGNTFALIDARHGSSWELEEKALGIPRAKLARMVCDPVLGISADGLLFIQSGSEGFDYDWDFYNSDGSTAEMCGNAARCAARFCGEGFSQANKNTLRFKTGAGLVVTEALDNGQIRVRMPQARFLQREIELKTKSSSVERFSLVNTGVPHLVQKIHDMADVAALKEMAREARAHHDLKPAGANVTFYTEESLGKIRAITFERGVEDYTLACGTGAVAAALVHSDKSAQFQVEVTMPGGVLLVLFSKEDPHPAMIGSALFVGDFKYNLEVLK